MKKKSRFSIGYIISALVMLVLGGVVGAYIGTLGELNIAVIVLFVVFLYLSMVLHIIIHEFGHMVFGLLTGYRFLSFRVFNLTLIREDGKLRFKKYTLAGTSGQCLMSPPDFADGKIPVMLYNFGGAFMNLIVSALCFPLFWTFQSSTAPGMFFLVVCLLGVAYAILNGLPMRMGAVNNDGKNAVSLGGNAGALRAWWIQLKLVELTVGGARLRDMPEEWFALPPEEEMGNPLIAYLAVCACSRLMDRHDFAQAREL
ncbi:MAG: M50 family metallopeptidase, partial [Oscillospiraceae bacterium]|nr:M50 family metallopeptidase [Oscillospiraceae bacterium]